MSQGGGEADARRSLAQPLSRRAIALSILGALTAIVLASSGQTIFITAMPKLVSELGGLSLYPWVFSLYMLTMAISVPLYGRLSDIYGRQPLLVAAVFVYVAGSLIGALAGSMPQVVLARAVQGLASGALLSLPQALIADLVPLGERAKWQGVLGAAIAVSSILGPLGGGWIADHLSWQWVFVAPLPLAATVLAVNVRTARPPVLGDRPKGLDYLGAALLTIAVAGALLAVAAGGSIVSWDSPALAGLALVSALGLAGFVRHEDRSPDPLVPLPVLRSRTVAAANAANFVLSGAQFSAVAFVPLFVQGALGASATSAGLVLMPLMIALVVTNLAAGSAVSRTGRYRWALLTGPLPICVAFAWLATQDETASRIDMTAGMVALGVGMGLLWQPLILAIQIVVPARDMGVGTSTAQLSRSIGNCVGVAVSGAIVSSRLDGSAGLQFVTSASEVMRAELASAVRPIFVVGVAAAIAILAFVLLIREAPLKPEARLNPRPPQSGLET